MHSCLRYSVGDVKGTVVEFAKGLVVKRNVTSFT